MTRRQSHLWYLWRIPSGHDDAAVGGINFNAFDDFFQLVDSLARVVVLARAVLCSEVSPLEAVDWSQVSNFAVLEARRVEKLTSAVAVPDFDVFRLKNFRIGGSFDEPEKFLCDGSPEHSLRRQQWKLIAKIKSHLRSEDADCADSRAISSGHTLSQCK